VRREIQLAHQQSATLIDVLAQSVADALRSGDREALRRVLNAAVAQSAFGEVRFQERNGRELVAVAPVPDEPAAAAPAPLAGWIRERLNGHDRTIAVRGQDRGVLRAQPAVDEVVTQVWLAVQRALWLGALALAAGLVLMRVLLARWLAPLGRMARFVEQAGGSPAASIAAGADEPEEIRHALAQAASAAGGLRDRFGRRIQALDRALLQQRQAIDRVLMVVELSADGAIVSVNDLFCEVAGWSREEAIGRKDLWSLAADRYRDLARAAPRSPSWVGEVACRRRDGSLLWVKRTAVPFDGPQEGAAGGLLCLDVDITRRKAAEQRAVEEKERAEVTLQALAEGVIRVDAASRVAYANLAAQRLLGLDAQALQGRPLEQVFSLDLSGEADQTSASGTHSRFVITLHDGRQLTVELSRTSLLDAAGQPAGDVVAFRDVTQEQRIRHELQRLSLAVRHAASGIMITDAQGRIEYVNPRFTELTGFELDEVRGQTPRFLKSGETPVAVYDAMWRSLRSGQSWRGELVNRRRNGSLFWCSQTLASVLDGDGRATECVAVMEDVTERKEAEATIHRLAYYDALTDLPNRRMFMERAVQDVRHAREQGLALAACYLDLDGFKNVNDTLGHQVGDVLLAEVARRIRGCLSARDFLGRLGGDEFALLLHDAGSPDAVLGTGRRIIELLEEVFVIDDNEIFISTSIGVAMYPDDGQDVADLLRKADMALYEAKEMGKRKVMPFTAQLEAQRQGRARLEQALRDAVPRQELRLVYQPKVDMRQQRGDRLRGPAALAAPRARAALAGPLRAAGRGDAADRAHGPLDPAGGLPADPPLERGGSGRRQRGGQHLAGAVPRARAGGRHRAHRPRVGHPALAARDRDHRERPDGRPGRGGRHPRAPAGDRPDHRDRRLRHRLLLAGLPEVVPGRRPQGGPLLRARPGARRQRPRHRRGGDLDGAGAARQGRRRGRGNARPAQHPAGHGLPVRPGLLLQPAAGRRRLRALLVAPPPASARSVRSCSRRGR
jgi:diguanylate cyclase (GGDEF)-like protein/PAS domain S-box-containing protein